RAVVPAWADVAGLPVEEAPVLRLVPSLAPYEDIRVTQPVAAAVQERNQLESTRRVTTAAVPRGSRDRSRRTRGASHFLLIGHSLNGILSGTPDTRLPVHVTVRPELTLVLRTGGAGSGPGGVRHVSGIVVHQQDRRRETPIDRQRPRPAHPGERVTDEGEAAVSGKEIIQPDTEPLESIIDSLGELDHDSPRRRGERSLGNYQDPASCSRCCSSRSATADM